MKKFFALWLCAVCTLGTARLSFAQVTEPGKSTVTDTLKKYQSPGGATPKKPFLKSKIVKATIVPAILIGYGLSTVNDNGFYSSYDAKQDLQRSYPNFKTSVDNYLIFAPFVELGLAYALQEKGNHDFLNTGLLILKAEAINAALVFGMKSVTNIERPNGEDAFSLPSGHTAHAFLAASIIHSELKHRSQWYGIGAYSIATSVGALRMLNNKHWQSDVFVGAGIGILSSHMAYLSHRNRWGRKPMVSFQPAYIFKTPGVGLALNVDRLSNRKGLRKIPAARAGTEAIVVY